MTWLIAGLVIFIGMHSIRIVGEAPRAALIRRIGELAYKGTYGLISLLGLILIGQGYREAQIAGGVLYTPPAGLTAVTLILVPVSLVLLFAAYMPAGHIKRAVRHPMVLAVALWAMGHLLANGMVADVVLFGAFLAWAILDYLAALRRAPRPVAPGIASWQGDVIAILAGLGTTILLVVWLHEWLFGVAPVG
ncbi:NnrU family protein [Fulvimarina sp. 2208YS6-2-32]|uniref:NnrU family protein n=1 Tax=Fulvimarina uroteuthidis TaxID=3098149 RepID=A0ABU5I4X3_9HYPH|nr:NnrU family protein [Fulvimarina sp. 2208YS6-2-32]MDY8110422.1 NnrU family protein [Fulvimarina sp. 2208YS6-2-32]